MSYSFFARFYDGLMSNAEYEKRCDYILRLCERFEHKPGITLDLACGTGTLTRMLKKRGVDVFGVDSSGEMLCEAARKTADAGLEILYLRQKMQNLDLYGTIDTCVCTLDSINHLKNPDDAAKAIDRVGLFMNDGGLFVFDVNTPYKHKEILADNAFVYETDDVFCVWRNAWLGDGIVNIDLDFFEEQDGLYSRRCESFRERAYTDAQIRDMLANAGFGKCLSFGDLSFDNPGKTEQRVVYAAVMEKSRNKKAN